MLRQSSVIDVKYWTPDPEFAIFPQGARAKDAFFSPKENNDECIVSGKRYLFKKSKKSYPDQFWGEVVSYRIGCAVGIQVPPAFVAVNSATGVCAALIEWFYVDAEEVSVLAGDLLTRIQPNFDRKKGTTHNLRDANTLMRAILGNRGIDRMAVNWRQWWASALFFDALIGNTDRHQDNWTLLLKLGSGEEIAKRVRIGPCFDNGTSLGHERFPDRVAGWDAAMFMRYVERGEHHVRWSMSEPIRGHFALLSRVLQEWPEVRTHCDDMLKKLSIDLLSSVLCDLPRLDCPVPLSQARYDFILKLLIHRIDRLRAILEQ